MFPRFPSSSSSPVPPKAFVTFKHGIRDTVYLNFLQHFLQSSSCLAPLRCFWTFLDLQKPVTVDSGTEALQKGLRWVGRGPAKPCGARYARPPVGASIGRPFVVFVFPEGKLSWLTQPRPPGSLAPYLSPGRPFSDQTLMLSPTSFWYTCLRSRNIHHSPYFH